MPRGRIAFVLFARVPCFGRVKTRLTPELTKRQAFELHVALVLDSLRQVRKAARSAGGIAVMAWSRSWEPKHSTPWRPLRAALRGFIRQPQQGSDLGARLRRTFRQLFRAGFARVVVLGSDSPTLPLRNVLAAGVLLRRGADLVLGPAADGGYYLIGLTGEQKDLFRDLPWGTGRVMARTLRRARGLGLRVGLLPVWHDVDRIDDVRRLRRELAGPRRRRAPMTARALRTLPRSLKR